MSRSNNLTTLPWRVAAACSLALVGLSAQAAPKCAALKSGDYWTLSPLKSVGAERVNKVTIDASTLAYTFQTGETGQLSKTNEACALVDAAFGEQFKVSKSGVILTHNASGDWSLVLPAQPQTLKALVGTWNGMNYNRKPDGLFAANNGLTTINKRGVVSSADCGNGVDGACGAASVMGTLTVNPAGGFDFTKTGTTDVSNRFFLVKAKDGNLLLVGMGVSALTNIGSVNLATPVKTVPVLAVSDAWSIWDVGVNSAGMAGAAGRSSFTVTASDPVAGTFTRQRAEDCRVDTLFVNTGRAGMVHRPAGSYTRCDGSTGGYAKTLMLGGLNASFGFSPYGWSSDLPADPRYFGFSVVRP